MNAVVLDLGAVEIFHFGNAHLESQKLENDGRFEYEDVFVARSREFDEFRPVVFRICRNA